MAGAKLVFFDVDGVLLTSAFTVPESAGRAIRAARANGHLCVINSGRPYSHVDPRIREIGFDGYVCSCGMNVMLHGESLLHESFSPAFSHACVRVNREQHVEVIYESEEGMWFDFTQPMNSYLQRSHDHFGQFVAVDGDIDSPEFFFDKFSAWCTEDTDLEAYLAFLEPHFDIILRAPMIYELVAKGYTKATGMDLIRSATGIPFEDTYALGDSRNDLLMLQNVAHPIVMGNGMEEVKELAEFVTDDLEFDGVEKALQHYGLI